MEISIRNIFPRTICLLVATSGFATLSWEVLWQIKATLALGVSAWGTAITLAIIMGGMSLGGFLMGHALRNGTRVNAIHLYGLLEITAGVAGLALNSAFHNLEKLDTWAYASMPESISLIYIFGMIVVLGVPTLCMGASLPLFGIISKQNKLSVATLYSINVFGAATGVLFVGMIAIPLFGVANTIRAVAAINILIGCISLCLGPGQEVSPANHLDKASTLQSFFSKNMFIVFVTGFATFSLEVAWFRSFATVFANTTDVFAIILACMLIALGIAAKKIPLLKFKKKMLGTQLCIAGILILLITPLIERIDTVMFFSKPNLYSAATIDVNGLFLNPETFVTNGLVLLHYVIRSLLRFVVLALIIIPPVQFLGIAFPWLLDNYSSAYSMGKLYAANTFAAIVGSIGAAWLLLPTIGFAKTAWVAGCFVVVAGILITPGRKRFILAAVGVVALLIAIFFETGIGKTRAQGFFATDEEGKIAKVLDFFEGPDATTSAVEYNDGTRALLINSALAAWESGNKYRPSAHYMAWMGHLPMLIHSQPKKALVICFGTGQTSNAVRKENPEELDIVDINPNVFKLAHHFKSNENVLSDSRVKAITMDGRAYLRRTKKIYDVITLEPMPPTTVGVNALYSKEFYQLARKKLGRNGVIAQWIPFHIAAPHYNASIANTFISVFPNSVLWIDPESRTGILLGTKDAKSILPTNWPGFARTHITRDLSPQDVQQYIALNTKELQRYASYGEIINDDNQLLSYGKALYTQGLLELNSKLLQRINNKISLLRIDKTFR